MKRCPTCDRTYTDPSLNFCLEDGTPLTLDAPAVDPNATIRYPSARDTAEPPPTEIYRPEPAVTAPTSPTQRRPTPTPPPPPPPQQQWVPGPTAAPPRKKSNAIWWILGGFTALVIVGVGLVVLVIALASLSNNTNNSNANVRNDNRNANATANANANSSNANANANASVPGSFTDDFSQQKWGTGKSDFGRIWYDGGEYHMTSRERTFVVMYAPATNDYNTENATVKITARSVNGDVPSAGFGLMVHCVQTREKKLEDYALLIYPSAEPEYEVIMHKDGVQSSLVQKTKSSAIHSGNSPNQLEVRIKGTELQFYANGQFLTKVTDTANYRRGRAGLYTSDSYEVAFDDLTISRQP
jgi:hypothetical protein